MDRDLFFNEFTELLTKHEIDNVLMVYVGGGKVFNTTFNRVENEASEVLNNLSDTINAYFNNGID